MRGAMVTMDFSQRMGLAPAIKVAQVDSIDKELRNSIWSILDFQLFSKFYPYDIFEPDTMAGSNFTGFGQQLYFHFLKQPIDTIPRQWSKFRLVLRDVFFNSEWHRAYSLLEFITGLNYLDTASALIEDFNEALSRENSAYRFVSGLITPITSKEEIEDIERALAIADQYAGARTHLQTSIGLLTDRSNPDYRNSIKESISAVESLAKKLVGDEKATLGQALKILETKHKLHASLKSAFMTLYGYTSEAGGIRHALLDNTIPPTKADARFMLICCSAFINFAIDSIED
ncbi:hypothetical protein D3C79_626520 [compost metagenome]